MGSILVAHHETEGTAWAIAPPTVSLMTRETRELRDQWRIARYCALEPAELTVADGTHIDDSYQEIELHDVRFLAPPIFEDWIAKVTGRQAALAAGFRQLEPGPSQHIEDGNSAPGTDHKSWDGANTAETEALAPPEATDEFAEQGGDIPTRSCADEPRSRRLRGSAKKPGLGRPLRARRAAARFSEGTDPARLLSRPGKQPRRERARTRSEGPATTRRSRSGRKAVKWGLVILLSSCLTGTAFAAASAFVRDQGTPTPSPSHAILRQLNKLASELHGYQVELRRDKATWTRLLKETKVSVAVRPTSVDSGSAAAVISDPPAAAPTGESPATAGGPPTLDIVGTTLVIGGGGSGSGALHVNEPVTHSTLITGGNVAQPIVTGGDRSGSFEALVMDAP